MSDRLEPFEVIIAEPELEDLRARLRATRWPEPAPTRDWAYGTDLTYLQDLCAYWADEFDWRAQEARINAFDQVTTEIDGQRVHTIHARSTDPEATPLLISHGWPGSVVEFLDIIEPLRETCHVVAPSLPGYAWSGPTTEPGWDTRRVADCLAELMTRLGYDRFVAQGGDWGAMITTQLGLRHPERLAGIHLNLVLAAPPEGVTDFTDQELADLAAAGEYQASGSGYAQIKGTKPQSLGYGLTDSPAGLAGWIAEKFLAWTDNDGTIESAVDRDALLANISTYWFTRTAPSSARLYYETMKSGLFGPLPDRVEVPTGGAIFPREIYKPSRRFAEAVYRVVHWSEFDRGGHFAALEQPEVLVADIREFLDRL